MMAKIYYTRAQRIKKARRALYSKKFEGTTRAISNDIQRMIIGGLQRKDSNAQVAARIAEKHPSVDEAHARLIVRNETHGVQSIMREIQYHETDLIGTGKYVWQGTPDKRYCIRCKKIYERTKHGVPLELLRQIIKEEAEPKTYDERRPWQAHINDRCLVRRIFL